MFLILYNIRQVHIKVFIFNEIYSQITVEKRYERTSVRRNSSYIVVPKLVTTISIILHVGL
jgi:hypothetical protein